MVDSLFCINVIESVGMERITSFVSNTPNWRRKEKVARRKNQLTQKDISQIRYCRQKGGLSAKDISTQLGIPLDLVMEFVVYLDGENEGNRTALPTTTKRRIVNEPKKIGDPITIDDILDVAKIPGKELWREIFGGKENGNV